MGGRHAYTSISIGLDTRYIQNLTAASDSFGDPLQPQEAFLYT